MARQPRAVRIVSEDRRRDRTASGAISSPSTARSTASTTAARAAPPGFHRRVLRPRQARTHRQARAAEPLQARHSRRDPAGSALTDTGFVATELDSVPGGMGFVGAMAEAYCKPASNRSAAPTACRARSPRCSPTRAAKRNPTVAIVVSEESGDYRAELRWLADACAALGEVKLRLRAARRRCSPKRRSSCATRTAAKRDSTCSIATSNCSICSTFPSKS